MARRAVGGEVGEDLADHRRELEAVAGAGRGDDDLRRARQTVDQEIAVRGHGVETGLGRDHAAIRGGKMRRDGGADQGLVGRRYGPIATLRIDPLVTMMMLGDLDAAADAGPRRNAVVHAVPALQDEDREVLRTEPRRIRRLEPCGDLARHPQRAGKRRHEGGRPWSGGDDGCSRLDRAVVRDDARAAGMGLDRPYRLARADGRPVRGRELEQCGDRRLDRHKATVGLQHRDEVRRHLE